MAAIRHIRIARFRGFELFELAVDGHAVVLGESGAGRSDLIEALVRTLDSDYPRFRRGDELDFYAANTSEPAEVTVTVGALGDIGESGLFSRVELWDRDAHELLPELVEAADFDAERHEEVLRLTYRIEALPDGAFDEYVYWPKSARPGQERASLANAAERSEIPFFSGRSASGRAIDLAARSQFRKLVNAKAGEDVERAIDRLVAAVEEAAEEFATQERVAAALRDVIDPLRETRRIPDAAEPSTFVRFLPQGGARTSMVRGLDAAIRLEDSPELPVDRHGSGLAAALRAGLLLALSGVATDSIVVIDDFGSELEPLMARHLAERLRERAGQLIVTSRQPHIATAFRPDEIVRLHTPAARAAATGRAITALEGREIARFLTTQLIPAMTASAVVVVDGPHDRLALDALARRLTSLERLPSFPASGIAFTDAEGTGSLRPLASAARAMGLFTTLLLDNDEPPGAPLPPHLERAAAAADVAILLPPRVALERLLFAGISDDMLIRVVTEIGDRYDGARVPAGLATMAAGPLRRAAAAFLKQTPSLHEAFVEELPETELAPGAATVLGLIYERVAARQPGFIRLTGDFSPET